MQHLEQIQREEQTQQQIALQVAVASMVELSVMDFKERVRNEMEENEALEEVGPDEVEDSEPTTEETMETNSLTRLPTTLPPTISPTISCASKMPARSESFSSPRLRHPTTTSIARWGNTILATTSAP